MKKLLIFFFLLPLSIVYSQSIVSPVISAGFSFYSYENNNSLILLNNYKLAGGVQLFERWNIVGNVSFLNTQHLIDGQNEKIKAIPLSLSTDYRFFKNFWVSPMIGFEVGGMVYSNVKNKNVNSRLEIDDQEFNSIFKNWRGFITPQVLISFKMKDVYLNIGAGYSMLSYTKSDYFQKIERQTVYGIELKATVSYRF